MHINLWKSWLKKQWGVHQDQKLILTSESNTISFNCDYKSSFCVLTALLNNQNVLEIM